MPRRQFPGVSSYRDRHGKLRWRYQRRGVRAEIGALKYGSPAFIARYEEITKGVGKSKADRVPAGSLDALIVAYYQSAKYAALADSTKVVRRGILERMRAEMVGGEPRGRKKVRDLRRRDVLAIMAKMADRPQAANNRLKVLRVLMKLALQLEWRTDDPTLGVDRYPSGKGFHTWTEAEVAKFYKHHTAGTLAHTAMTLMLYTGAARSDAVALGWGNVRAGRIEYRRQKMQNRNGVLVSVPIHPALSSVLSGLPRDNFTFLQTAQGKSRSPNGLGNLMREWCDAAGLPKCTSHGLRKAIARRLAESGATASEIAAVTGHKTLSEVAHYSEAADRAGLADSAMARLGNGGVANHPARFANSDE